SSCHSFLYCHKCSLTTISAKLKSLTLIKSNVQLLEPAAALFFFYAGWTNLNTVRDLVFSKEASTARFEFSEINFIEKLTSMSDVNFKNCKIKNISSKSVTSFSSFTVVNSSIARIESNGIVAFSRTGVSFQNVFIEDLQELAVVVTGAGDLVLENVTIGRCKMPCFEVPSYENIKLVGHIFLNG
ncbi:Pectin lyase fold/virulence factor, partial [Trinorchestia longiramus]